MAHNYFVSYDLIAPGQHYDKVIAAIQACGPWAKVELSFYYVKSELSLETITERVWGAMTPNDKLIVIDSTINNFYAHNLDPAVLEQMQKFWMV